MKQREADLLYRLSTVVSDIPQPQGRRAAALEAVTGYVDDMRFAQPKVSSVLYLLSHGDVEEAKEILLSLEIWALNRQAVDWK